MCASLFPHPLCDDHTYWYSEHIRKGQSNIGGARDGRALKVQLSLLLVLSSMADSKTTIVSVLFTMWSGVILSFTCSIIINFGRLLAHSILLGLPRAVIVTRDASIFDWRIFRVLSVTYNIRYFCLIGTWLQIYVSTEWPCRKRWPQSQVCCSLQVFQTSYNSILALGTSSPTAKTRPTCLAAY